MTQGWEIGIALAFAVLVAVLLEWLRKPINGRDNNQNHRGFTFTVTIHKE